MIKLFSSAVGFHALVFAGLGLWLPLHAQAQSAWVKQPPDFKTVVFGNNIFVAAGRRGEILTSKDGVEWQSKISGTTNALNSIAFGGGKFVAVGEKGRILTSSDALAWSAQDSHTTLNLNGVTFGNGSFVAVGDGSAGQIRSSVNGNDWVERVNGVQTTQPLRAVTFGKVTIGGNLADAFVAVGDGGAVYYSADAQTWNFTPSGTTAALNGVASGDGILVAAGYEGTAKIIRSTTGLNWTTQTGITAPNRLRGVTFGNHTFVAVGDGNEIQSSPDGITWTHRNTPDEAFQDLFFTSVAHGNNTFVAVALRGAIFTSTDGQVWTARSFSPPPLLMAAGYGELFVAVGWDHRGNSAIQTSTDGVLWIERDSGTKLNLNGVAYGNKTYVVTGDGIILTASDGINWTAQTTVNNARLHGVAFGNGLFVTAGYDENNSGNTSIHTSTNGVNWVERSLDLPDFKAITYGNNLFVMVSGSGIVTSPDGINWTLRFSDNSMPLWSVAYGNNTFVAVGDNFFSAENKHGIIVTSTDGVNWTPQPVGVFDSLSSVTFGNNTFVAVGWIGTDVIVTSANGIDWSPAVAPFVTEPTAVTFGRGRFVSVGQSGILTSGEFQPILIQPTPQLPAFNGFSYTTAAPIRSSNPWRFTAVQSSTASDLRVRVQSTLKPNDEVSWTDLPGAFLMGRLDANWTLNTIDVPTGDRYFRAIASAPGYLDRVTEPLAVIGPITVLGGIAPFGDFSYETTSPLRTGTDWTFTMVQPSLVSDLRLRVQSSANLQDENSWSDLPGGGRMGHLGSTWSHTTSELPVGTRYFRVVASAVTYVDRVSEALGPFTIGASLPVEEFRVSGPARYSLASLPEPPDIRLILIQVWGEDAVEFIMESSDKENIIKDALAFYAEQNASVRLTVNPGQSLTSLGINIGPNASLILGGTINGSLNLHSQIVSNDGATIVANDGATLMGRNASIVSGGGGNIVSGGGGNIISGGGGNIVSGGGGNIVSGGGGNSPVGAGMRSMAAPSTGPAFTGVMTVNGDYRQEAGTGLVIAIAGANTASTGFQEYDQLAVSGRADLGGTIGFSLFDPSNLTNQVNIFQPPAGAIFDVVVAANIVTHDLIVRGPMWGDGLHFNWSVVNRTDGKQALRLVAAPIAPFLVIQRSDAVWEVAYPENFTGYVLQRSATLTTPNWTLFSNSTNRVKIDTIGSTGFFRMLKQ
jgi:hypothetical protein